MMIKTQIGKKPNLDERIFMVIRDNPTFTREDVAKHMGISLQRVRERVAVMKKKGWLTEKKVLVPINKRVEIKVK